MKSKATNLTAPTRSECEPSLFHGGSKSFDVATSTRDVYWGTNKKMIEAYCRLEESLKDLSVSQDQQESCAHEHVSHCVAKKTSIDISYLLRMDDDLMNSDIESDDDLFSIDSIQITMERRKRKTMSSKGECNSPKKE